MIQMAGVRQLMYKGAAYYAIAIWL